ncbi:MAG: SUMF1/EgtB/PvdO family nonheme iron enzyme [Rubrivivax sp.]|nr:SUMF1/EgtB/PvdO family nonheme iron enzyme [Rubrivivax sp.]
MHAKRHRYLDHSRRGFSPPLPLRLFATLLLWLAVSVQPAQAARLALVVGNDDYRYIATLKNAVRDAELMERTLRDAGFQVEVQRNLGRQALFDAVDRLQRRLNNGDEVAFFFAGHGVQVGNDQVLLPVDIQADDERKLLREGVPLLYVQDALKAARLAMLVVDACRDNPFPSSGTRSLGEARGLRPPEPARGQVVILSAGRGEKALDKVPGEAGVRNGLFTWEFARVLRSPGLDVLSALRRVRDQVEDRATSIGHRQRPSLVDDLRGQFYLFSAGAVPEPPPPRPVAQPTETPRPAAPSAPVGTVTLPAGTVFKDCPQCPEMVVVPEGSFVMGSPETEAERDSELPQRQVNVRRFAAGKFELTFEQWDWCLAAGACRHRPSDNGWGRGRRPVIDVSWEDAQQYVQWLSAQTGKTYRLLTEAEWEYATRAGTTGPFHTGPQISPQQANFDGNYSYNGSATGQYRARTVEVGQFGANAFGLHDMHGNVWEWVQDVWYDYYIDAPTDGSARMTGDQARRVLRGGSWGNLPRFLRSAQRYFNATDYRGNVTGFRIARTL